MKQKQISRWLKIAAGVLLALVLVLGGTVFALWYNELETLSSFHKLSDRDPEHNDGAVYQLTVSRAVRPMTQS